MIGVTASTLINKLVQATLKSHWAAIADYCGGAIIDLIGANASKNSQCNF